VRVKLERVKNGVALRTSEVVGDATLAFSQDLTEFPVYVGQRFRMTAPPLDPAALIPVVETSPVVAIIETQEPDGTGWQVVFQTENSTYRLTRLPDAPGSPRLTRRSGT
jgi:hypothetical protein